MRSKTFKFFRFAVPLLSVGLLACTVQILPASDGSGTVTTGSGTCTVTAGIPDASCTVDADNNDVLTLTATATAGSTFVAWTGDCDTIVTNVCTTAADRLKFVRPEFAPDSAPDAPTTLLGTALAGPKIGLLWVDNSDNEAKFEIERCTGTDCTNFAALISLPAAVPVSAYVDQTVSAATTYKYRVRAVNSLGNSTYATSVNINVP